MSVHAHTPPPSERAGTLLSAITVHDTMPSSMTSDDVSLPSFAMDSQENQWLRYSLKTCRPGVWLNVMFEAEQLPTCVADLDVLQTAARQVERISFTVE